MKAKKFTYVLYGRTSQWDEIVDHLRKTGMKIPDEYEDLPLVADGLTWPAMRIVRVEATSEQVHVGWLDGKPEHLVYSMIREPE